jgi:hypothetical protein
VAEGLRCREIVIKSNARGPAGVVERIQQDEQDAPGAENPTSDQHHFLLLLGLLDGNCRLFRCPRASAARGLRLFRTSEQANQGKKNK